jgi:hypothetical protein
VLKAVELPAGIAGLDAALADMDGDYFTHVVGGRLRGKLEELVGFVIAAAAAPSM